MANQKTCILQGSGYLGHGGFRPNLAFPRSDAEGLRRAGFETQTLDLVFENSCMVTRPIYRNPGLNGHDSHIGKIRPYPYGGESGDFRRIGEKFATFYAYGGNRGSNASKRKG